MKDKGLRLSRGSWHLDRWADGAAQIHKNAAYAALFALVDGSAFSTYQVLDDVDRGREFFLVLREDLVIKVAVANFDTFGLLYIGPPDGAPGLHRVLGQRASRRSRPGVDPDQRSLEA